jgi:hypothetical protein
VALSQGQADQGDGDEEEAASGDHGARGNTLKDTCRLGFFRKTMRTFD